MGNLSRTEGYVSELLGMSKIKLEDGDIKVLVEILHAPQTVYSMTKIINEKIEFKVPIGDADGSQNFPQDAPAYRIVYWTAGPLTEPAVRKRFRKLAKFGLIEEIKDEKKLPRKTRFAFHQKGRKPLK